LDCFLPTAFLYQPYFLGSLFPVRSGPSRESYNEEKGNMAARKKTGSIEQGSSAQSLPTTASSPTGEQGRQKVDDLVEIIRGLVDSRGFFDPKEVHEQARNTDLAKSASIIMSNLRLQGFGKDDKLRVPVTDRPDAIKKLINLASRLRKKGLMVPFDEAVTMILSESPEEMTEISEKETNVQPEPKHETKAATQPLTKAVPTVYKPTAPKSFASLQAQQAPEPDFKSLYEETRDKALKLEAELEAYKQVCFRLIETLRK
jgi:hypothetical protein